MSDANDMKYLNTKQAAARLGMSYQWLNALRIRGGGPRYSRMARNAIRYDIVDLDAWAEQRKARSTAEYNGEVAP